ncbi:MAG: transposase, partial [Stellaceae bacterium]
PRSARRRSISCTAQTRGRQRLNLPGALDLERGPTCMLEVSQIDVMSTIALLSAIEALYPMVRSIHVFLDNARAHHAKIVRNGSPGHDVE